MRTAFIQLTNNKLSISYSCFDIMKSKEFLKNLISNFLISIFSKILYK